MADSAETDGAGTVVLLHGLWLAPVTLWLLARRVARCGFRPVLFGYSTVRADLDTNARSLARFCRDLDGGVLHFIGYSLGGLVTLRALALGLVPKTGRVVLMGSPVGGTRASARLRMHRWGRHAVGRSLPEWRPGDFPDGVTAGMIAGSRPVGLGSAITRLDPPHDGTVAVSETQDPRLAGHIVLPVTHLELLLSRRAAEEACRFLRHGRFGHEGEAP